MAGLVPIPNALVQLEVSERTFRRMLATGEFPPLVKRSRRCVYVRQSDIDDFLKKLLEGRAAGQPA
ncbi:MAG TPA: helix-turn-helix domain-containing protein [Gemmataceae bacterium]|jgi:predicted DNA-binding transcriptional regulator AlpA